MNIYNFPVYPLREHYEIYEEEGLVKVHSNYGIKVIDNKYNNKETLVERRMSVPKDDLYSLKYACSDFQQMVVTNKRYNYTKFIDSLGEIFSYKPTTNVKAKWVQPIYYESRCGSKYLFEYRGYMLSVKEPSNFLLIGSLNGSYLILDARTNKPEKINTWRKI